MLLCALVSLWQKFFANKLISYSVKSQNKRDYPFITISKSAINSNSVLTDVSQFSFCVNLCYMWLRTV